MKLSTFLLVLPATLASAWEPSRIQYSDLVAGKSPVHKVLQETGLIAIQGVPSLGSSVLRTLPACVKTSALTQEATLADGSVRKTIATHTVPNGMQKMHHKCPDCADDATDTFRKAAAEVTEVFTKQLTKELGISKSLLNTESGYSFDTLSDVVENGPHLEHFHSYEASSAVVNPDVDSIEWHTDQGMFIVFTPARWSESGEPTRGFMIQLADGSKQEVTFSSEDDLVVMMGDGIEQIVNPSLPEDSRLRIPPHAVKIPTSSNESRVWYGLMVLPPLDALHPEHGERFGDIRAQMAKGESPLGCSHESAARVLEETVCEDGELNCWHRCMSLAEQGLESEADCTEQGLDLWCINPRGQLTAGGHGDLFPGCIDSATAIVETPYPSLPNYPRDEEECTDFEAFYKDDMYDHSVMLTDDCVFQYKISEDRVQGKLSYSGLFGYIALGFWNEGGAKNGMHGAQTLIAVPGGEYSATEGLDFSVGTQIGEVIIPDESEKSAFRHWADQVSLDATGVAVERQAVETPSVDANDCFTSLSFDTASIQGRSFDVEGMDSLIWAVNTKDTFAGYHQARGNFTVEWGTGEHSINAPFGSEVIEEPSVESGSAVIGTAFSAMILMAVGLFQW